MAGSIGPISSVVVIPETEAQSPPSKRRHSSTSDTHSKRARLSHGESSGLSSAAHGSPDSAGVESSSTKPSDGTAAGETAKKPKSSEQEERKRGRRLFGGLLSTLSQTTPNGQQKRRVEIEKRQAEKAQRQKVDDEAHRAEKIAKLKAVRKSEQMKFNEGSMRTRHSNMLAMANVLHTKTEPKLYYKPWKLLPEEDDRIKKQIAEAEAIVGHEREEFYKLYPGETRQEAPASEEKANITSQETVGEPRAESPPISSNVPDITNPPVEAHRPEQATNRKHSLEEHSGEVVLEADEDTVIY